jgi:hypothetical protein
MIDLTVDRYGVGSELQRLRKMAGSNAVNFFEIGNCPGHAPHPMHPTGAQTAGRNCNLQQGHRVDAKRVSFV